MRTTGGIVDVGHKPDVKRRAVAQGTLQLRPSTVEAIRSGTVPKGDVTAVARTAATLAVKETPRLLPYCHPVPLDAVDVAFDVPEDGDRVVVRVTVEARYRTGVEMEALTGATIALLTVWDLVKPLEKDDAGQYPDARITDVRVVEKVKG